MSCQDISKEMSFDSSQWACEWDISFAQITHIHNGWHMSITTRTSHIFISRTSHIFIMDERCLSRTSHKHIKQMSFDSSKASYRRYETLRQPILSCSTLCAVCVPGKNKKNKSLYDGKRRLLFPGKPTDATKRNIFLVKPAFPFFFTEKPVLPCFLIFQRAICNTGF